MTTDGLLPDATARADQLSLRRHNLALVLRHVREAGPRSRARIATATGLNKATVSSLVAELMDSGLLREGTAERGGVGRPGQIVEVDGAGVYGVGAEVNVDYVAAVARDLGGRVVSERRRPVLTARLEPELVLDRLVALVAEVLDEASADGGETVGMTVAVPGLVDTVAGRVSIAPNLGWQQVPVVEAVRERLGGWTLPLQADNEANLAAIAEVSGPLGSRRRDLLVLFGATGIGGGIVAGGRLLRGARGLAGEIGHMSVDPHGLRCACGRVGCWETVAGLSALMGQVADPDDPVRDPARDLSDRLAELDRRARLGDGRTLAALQRLGTWIGVGAAVLVNVLNPAVLVLGGYFAALGRWLVDVVERELAAGVVADNAGGCRVEVSALGFAAAAHGGAEVALGKVLADPTLAGRQAASRAARPMGGVS